IASGVAPFAGTYRPEQSLATFNGLDAKGNWTLVVQDRASLDQGTLNSWSLSFTGTPGTGAGPALTSTTTSAHSTRLNSSAATLLRALQTEARNLFAPISLSP